MMLRENLDLPLRVKKPTVWAVWNDLFHESVPDDFICDVFARVSFAKQHTFLILTKRPKSMLSFFNTYESVNWPLPNVFLGVTAENQEQADKRIPVLLQIPAAVRFVSVEPMLGTVDITRAMYGPDPEGMNWFGFTDGIGYEAGIQWVICGGESGPGARPMHPDWARSLRDQCQDAFVPFFFKQWGEYSPEFDGKTKHTNCHSGAGMDEPCSMYCVGKKKAGRLLDGREWNEMPRVFSAAS